MAGSRISRELALLVTGKDVSASRTLSNVDRQVSSLERHMGKAGRSMGRNLERGVVIGATAAGGALAYSVKQAMDWESAFAGVRKTVEGTPEQLAAIEAGLRGMSREMPVTAQELAAIAENAGALGVAREDILEFTRTVAMLGATTDVSTDQASTALGQLGNVIDLGAQDYRGFAAALVDLGNKGASTESQILEIARRSGGAAKLFGIAKDETLGWAAAAANLGMNQELAGTALQSMFLKLLPEYTKGSKQLQQITGQTSEQLKRSFEKDATGSVEFLLQKLGEMPKDKRLEAVQDIFGKTSGLNRLILGLAESVDKNLSPALDTSVHAWGEGAAAAEEYEKRLQTTESQLTLFRNSVDDAAVTVGSKLLPIMVELAQEGTAWIDEHQEEIEQFGEDLAQNIREAVDWLQTLDLDAMVTGLRSAAGFAGDMVKWFAELDPGIQAFLITGFAANKFSGGVLGDVIGELAKGAIKGILGISAATVIVKGGVVQGAGGAPITPTGPGAGRPTSTVGRILDAGMKLALVGIVAEFAGEIDTALAGAAQDLRGQIGVDNFWKNLGIDKMPIPESWPWGSKNTPTILPEVFGGNGLLGGTEAHGRGRAGFERGEGRVAGGEWGKPINDKLGGINREQEGTTGAVKDVDAKTAEALVAFRSGERTSASGLANTARSATVAGIVGASATIGSASRIIGAIQANRPIVNVTMTQSVHVSSTDVTRAQTQTRRSGNRTSADGGGPRPNYID